VAQRAGPPLQKKIIFVPKIMFGCILTQFLTGGKHGHTLNLGTRILRFNRETKLTKTVQKLSKNSQSDQGRSHHSPSRPPEYATGPIRDIR